mmetsp:Transcript_58449/g.174099  ORF Transcript_58449/g.174099 Transcript_58449/m.174099 type:complete len:115 (-) Transcript_58449:678-1022(-)
MPGVYHIPGPMIEGRIDDEEYGDARDIDEPPLILTNDGGREAGVLVEGYTVHERENGRRGGPQRSRVEEYLRSNLIGRESQPALVLSKSRQSLGNKMKVMVADTLFRYTHHLAV